MEAPEDEAKEAKEAPEDAPEEAGDGPDATPLEELDAEVDALRARVKFEEWGGDALPGDDDEQPEAVDETIPEGLRVIRQIQNAKKAAMKLKAREKHKKRRTVRYGAELDALPRAETELGGVVVSLAGSGHRGHVDGPAGRAQLHTPVSVALAADGAFVVADVGPARCVRRVRADGDVATLCREDAEPALAGLRARAGAGGPARWWPGAVACDAASGRVIVTDRFNHCVRALAPAQT